MHFVVYMDTDSLYVQLDFILEKLMGAVFSKHKQIAVNELLGKITPDQFK